MSLLPFNHDLKTDMFSCSLSDVYHPSNIRHCHGSRQEGRSYKGSIQSPVVADTLSTHSPTAAQEQGPSDANPSFRSHAEPACGAIQYVALHEVCVQRLMLPSQTRKKQRTTALKNLLPSRRGSSVKLVSLFDELHSLTDQFSC